MAYTYKDENGKERKKKSGAKMNLATSKETGEQFPCINAWKSSKRWGMISLVARRKTEGKDINGKKKLTETYTKSGEYREIWVCTVDFDKVITKVYTGFYNPQKKTLRIPDLNYVASTTAPNGGYFGRSVFKK